MALPGVSMAAGAHGRRREPWSMLRSPLLPLLLLLVVLVQAQLRPLQPGPADPLRLLAGGDGPQPVILQGRLLGDPVAAGAPV
ncbi:hypothetical protein, partial [Synechococcus sp. BO 8801]